MNEPVCVYYLQGARNLLKQKASAYLGALLHFWVADVAKIVLGEGIPEDWRDQGAIFNERGELRWWRRDDMYEALVLTEKPVSDSDLEPAKGEWRGEENVIFLQDLNDHQVAPPFMAYPFGGQSGHLRVKEYRLNGVTMFVSLRGFIPREG